MDKVLIYFYLYLIIDNGRWQEPKKNKCSIKDNNIKSCLERFVIFLKQEKSDRRSRRTKRLLWKALTQLLMEKELKDITVMELTELADVNRGTFYLHYGNIYELYEEIEQNLIEEFVHILKSHREDKQQGTLFPVILDAFEFLGANADTCIAFLNHNNMVFLSKLLAVSKAVSLEVWEMLYGSKNPELHEYCYTFVTNGCVGLLRTWFMEGMKESSREMAELASRMMKGCIDSMGVLQIETEENKAAGSTF